ncbi:MerR family transcriptional regulator [Clostridium sp. CCUG 7971]|uniref:MerR family transcriptional regulator n=1 Tax=Clostridium sp. CCUG 7971 TaxID=2811414 RepID=UPI001ABB27B1|nr:MerR family transcriptional regulator [Clostridium sp. CCUG 7971]MBO3443844.1 MerR family transcriptional regulator [Clostridium sp. CCUG 7971]
MRYFSTGEFAKLFKINKKTLFHYDEIGLFKPEKVEENGYRYYAESQVDLFNVIWTLKDIGMPLKEIKTFMDNRNPENILELFSYEHEEIEKEIKNLRRKQEMLFNKINIVKEGKNFNNDIIIEEQEEEYLLLSRPVNNSEEPYDLNCYIDHLDYCYRKDLYIGYPVGVIISKDSIYNEDYADYSYYYTKVNKDAVNENIIVKPKGLYVVGYKRGYYDKTYILYKELIKFIEDNNLCIVGNSYENVIFDEVVAKNIDDYIIKISINVSYEK